MGLFDTSEDEDIVLENVDLDCEPQNDFVSEKEVEPLDERLEPGEKVHYLSKGGNIKLNGELKDGVTSIRVAITDRRVLIKQAKMMATDWASFAYRDISSVEENFGLVNKRLNLETSSKTYGVAVMSMDKDVVKDAARFIREQMRQANEPAESVTSDNSNDEDPLDKLERLGELREKGVVTEAEFEEKKASLMDQI